MKKIKFTICANVEYDGMSFGSVLIKVSENMYKEFENEYTAFGLPLPNESKMVYELIGNKTFNAEDSETGEIYKTDLYVTECMTDYEIWK